MDNMSEMLKGVLEGMVLQIISENEVYGYEIVKRLAAMGFTGMTEGTVYSVLLRLETNRLVHITKKPSALGPPRKFYTLNENGERERAAFWARWKFLTTRVEMLKNGGNGDGNRE